MACRSLFVFLSVLIAAPASATTLDFRHLETQHWAAQSALPGVTIEAGVEVDGVVTTGNAEVAHWRHGGLGVQSADDSDLSDGTEQLDSFGANDVVIFRFDRAVRLDRISFMMTNWSDRFDFYLGDDLAYQRTYKADDLSGSDWFSTVLLGEGYEGTTFAIGAAEYQSCGYSITEGHGCWTENSAFRIASITFEVIEVQAIPLPAGFALLLSGLIGMAFLRRRS